MDTNDWTMGGEAVIDVETKMSIDRPAGEVFAFVSDQTNAPAWQQGLLDVQRTTPGPIGVGSEHVFVRNFAGRRIESRNRFIAYDEAGQFVEFEIPHGPITGVASYRVDPRSAGACLLTSRMRFEVSGVMRLATPILARVLKRDSERDELRLKEFLEGRGAARVRA